MNLLSHDPQKGNPFVKNKGRGDVLQDKHTFHKVGSLKLHCLLLVGQDSCCMKVFYD